MGNHTAILNLKNLFSLHKDQASPEVIDITIRDFALIHKALRNLAIFVSISLFIHRKVGNCASAKCTLQASPSDAMKRLNNWACVVTPSFSLMRAR